MVETTPNPQINISRIPIGGGLGGGLAAVAMVLIILLGLPELWYAVPLVIAGGCLVAFVLHFSPHKNPGPRILFDEKR